MKRTSLSTLLLLLICTVLVPSALAQHTIWVSPLTMITGDARLTIEPTSPGPGTSVRITTTASGDLQWVDLGLVLPNNILIESIEFCYQLAVGSSFISQTRVTRMTTPDHATVIHDDGTDLTNVGPDCYASFPNPVLPVEGTLTLSFRLNFSSPGHWIDIGAIALNVIPVATAIQDDDTPDGSRAGILNQNYPNPFNPNTNINFELSKPQLVEISVYTIEGKLVTNLISEELPAGAHEITWNGRNDAGALVSSGVFLYRLKVGDFVETKRMVLVR